MSTGYRPPSPQQQFFDQNGNVLAGGLLYSYLAGTDTLSHLGVDAAFSSTQTDPIVLTAAGRATLFLDKTLAYKFVMQDADGVTIWTQDPVKVAWTADPSTAFPVGMMILWAGQYGPSLSTNWILCDGSFISQQIYADLYALIGQTYLDGQAEQDGLFPLPNFKTVTTGAGGRFALGRSNGGTGGVLGASGTGIDHTHTIDAHTHTGPSHSHDFTLAGTNDNTSAGGILAEAQVVTSVLSGTAATSGTGLTTGANNPPYVTLQWLIRF